MKLNCVKYLSKTLSRLIPEKLVILCIERYFSALPLSATPEKAVRIICTSQDILHSALNQAAMLHEPTGLHPKHRIMHYHDFFAERVMPGDRVLDIGCGIGAVAYAIAERGGEVTAVDISEGNIESAKKMNAHPKIQYICANALDYMSEKDIDVIIMSNVLEHIENRVGFLHNLVTSLSDARYLFRVPGKDRHWSIYFREELGLNWMLDETHYTEYTTKSFYNELNAAGLEIIHCEYQWEEIWAEAIHRR